MNDYKKKKFAVLSDISELFMSYYLESTPIIWQTPSSSGIDVFLETLRKRTFSLSRPYEHAVMVGELLVAWIEYGIIVVLPPSFDDRGLAVVRHDGDGHSGEELEGMHVASELGVHLLVQEPLAVEVPAVGKCHHEDVHRNELPSVHIHDVCLVPGPVDLALESWQLLDSNCYVVDPRVLAHDLAEARPAVIPPAFLLGCLDVVGPEDVIRVSVPPLPQHIVAVDWHETAVRRVVFGQYSLNIIIVKKRIKL